MMNRYNYWYILIFIIWGTFFCFPKSGNEYISLKNIDFTQDLIHKECVRVVQLCKKNHLLTSNNYFTIFIKDFGNRKYLMLDLYNDYDGEHFSKNYYGYVIIENTICLVGGDSIWNYFKDNRNENISFRYKKNNANIDKELATWWYELKDNQLINCGSFMNTKIANNKKRKLSLKKEQITINKSYINNSTQWNIFKNFSADTLQYTNAMSDSYMLFMSNNKDFIFNLNSTPYLLMGHSKCINTLMDVEKSPISVSYNHLPDTLIQTIYTYKKRNEKSYLDSIGYVQIYMEEIGILKKPTIILKDVKNIKTVMRIKTTYNNPNTHRKIENSNIELTCNSYFLDSQIYPLVETYILRIFDNQQRLVDSVFRGYLYEEVDMISKNEHVILGNGFMQDSVYYVQIKDYQGNVRAVLDQSHNLVERNEYYIPTEVSSMPATTNYSDCFTINIGKINWER